MLNKPRILVVEDESGIADTLLYVLAMAQADEPLQMFNAAYDLGSISMRSLRVG